MKKKTRKPYKTLNQSYICLTLFKPDIQELIRLFQTYLQDVEIVIDDKRILDSTQLEEFEPTYQAQSLIMQGKNPTIREAQTEEQGENSLVVLTIKNSSAELNAKKERGKTEPEVFIAIKKLLKSRHSRIQSFLISFANWIEAYIWTVLQSIGEDHHLNFVAQMRFLLIAGGLLLFITLALTAAIRHLLKLNTRVFLLPGTIKTTRTYGLRETIGTLAVTLVISFTTLIITVLALSYFWP